MLLQHRWREGTVRLTEFHLAVDRVLHVRAARIAEDAAVPQRAGAPFHPALIPADGAAFGEERRGLALDVADLARLESRRGDGAPQFGIRILRPPIRVLHDEAARPAETLVPDVEGNAERAS